MELIADFGVFHLHESINVAFDSNGANAVHRLPKFSRQPPGRFIDWGFRSDVWPRVAAAIYLLATTGLSTQIEIRLAMARGLGANPGSGSLKNLLAEYLPRIGLVSVANGLPLVRRARLNLIRLSDEGKELARMLETTPIESDWERMIRLHSAEQQLRHTVAVLYFAYQARLRGWQANVVPTLEGTTFEPDVLLLKDQDRVYVEVELGNEKLRKWRAQGKYQGFTALCALTLESRYGLVTECKSLSLPGRATDIDTLIKGSSQWPIGPLWAETWIR